MNAAARKAPAGPYVAGEWVADGHRRDDVDAAGIAAGLVMPWNAPLALRVRSLDPACTAGRT